jgi:hypothetical protein
MLIARNKCVNRRPCFFSHIISETNQCTLMKFVIDSDAYVQWCVINSISFQVGLIQIILHMKLKLKYFSKATHLTEFVTIHNTIVLWFKFAFEAFKYCEYLVTCKETKLWRAVNYMVSSVLRKYVCSSNKHTSSQMKSIWKYAFLLDVK